MAIGFDFISLWYDTVQTRSIGPASNGIPLTDLCLYFVPLACYFYKFLMSALNKFHNLYSRCCQDLEIRGYSLQEDKFTKETDIWNMD